MIFIDELNHRMIVKQKVERIEVKNMNFLQKIKNCKLASPLFSAYCLIIYLGRHGVIEKR